jgi:hypothetical protein
MEGNCKYIEQTAAESRQGETLRHGAWAGTHRIKPEYYKKLQRVWNGLFGTTYRTRNMATGVGAWKCWKFLYIMFIENSNNRISKIYVRFWWEYMRSDGIIVELNQQIII